MPAKEPANIYSSFFMPLRNGNIAATLATHKNTASNWFRGRRPMPAAKRRQLAEIMDAQGKNALAIAQKLREEAAEIEAATKPRKDNLSRLWRKKGAAMAYEPKPVINAEF